MKSNKILFTLLLIGLVTACSSQNNANESSLKRNYSKVNTSSASVLTTNTLDDLEESADIILSGKTINEVNENNSFVPDEIETDGKMSEEQTIELIENEVSSPTFISQVSVVNVYKGDLKEKTINIVFNYAVKNNTLMEYEGNDSPSYKGLVYTYFIKKFDKESLETYNRTLKTNYTELYYTVSSGTGMVNTDKKDKENLDIVESILPNKDIEKIQEDLS